jgi:membrane protein implicated in regulation of membrane protease activity
MTLLGVTIPIALVWLIIAFILAVIEAFSLGLTTIWFAGGAVVAVVAALLGVSVPLQVVIFVVVSILLLVLTRPWAMKHFKSKLESTNIDAVIGKEAMVTKEISPFSAGEAKLNGLTWVALATDKNMTIAAETAVKVDAVEGVKLIVTPLK